MIVTPEVVRKFAEAICRLEPNTDQAKVALRKFRLARKAGENVKAEEVVAKMSEGDPEELARAILRKI